MLYCKTGGKTDFPADDINYMLCPIDVHRQLGNLSEVFERYMNTRGKELSPRTANWYRQKVEGSLSSLKKLPVDRIDRATVRALHEKITRKSRGYGANGAMRVLKLLINDASRTYDLPPNPVTRGVRMNQEKARDWAVGPDNMPLLWQRLDHMEDRVRRACWLVMLLTGLRSSDARSLKWEHLDGDGVLTVPSPKAGGPVHRRGVDWRLKIARSSLIRQSGENKRRERGQ